MSLLPKFRISGVRAAGTNWIAPGNRGPGRSHRSVQANQTMSATAMTTKSTLTAS